MPRSLRVGLLVVVIAAVLVACGSAPPASFDPTGPCTADGRAPGAYPDLEALIPKAYRGDAPETLDSGRNCTASNLGALASRGISEVRFAGATWTFGAERALVLAVFRAPGLTTDDMVAFYGQSADDRGPDPGRRAIGADDRRDDPGAGSTRRPASGPSPSSSGRPSAKDAVNVVITNDLPDARIQDAIDAFGGQ